MSEGVSVNVISFKNESTVDAGNSDFKNSVAKSIQQLQSLQKQLNDYKQELGDKRIHKQIIPTVEQVPASELRIDWAEALSIAFDGSKYYLMVVDKSTEYYAAFPTASRTNTVDLVQVWMAETSKTPRVIRMDCAKEFVSTAMKALSTVSPCSWCQPTHTCCIAGSRELFASPKATHVWHSSRAALPCDFGLGPREILSRIICGQDLAPQEQPVQRLTDYSPLGCLIHIQP